MSIWWLVFPLLGSLAGVLAGLLGIGGGIVLVAALLWLLPLLGVPQHAAMHAALATSLASIIVTASRSAFLHHRRGSVMWPSVSWLVPGLLIGCLAGSRLAVAIDDEALRIGVAVFCLIIAWRLAFSASSANDINDKPAPRGMLLSVAGIIIGAISALVGIGGGSMTVPLLIQRGAVPVRAVGTSSACGIAIALASAAGYVGFANPPGMPTGSLGYVYLPAAIGLALGAVVAAPYGVRLAHQLSGQTLQRVFAGCLAVIGVVLFI